MLQNLDWPTFQHHHKRKRIILLYKSINGLIALNIPNYFMPISTNTRIRHHQTYHFTYIKTNAYMNSYFPKTIREWNSLPNQIIDCDSIDLFQENLDTVIIY